MAREKVDFLSPLDTQRTLASADDVVAVSHAQLAQDELSNFLTLEALGVTSRAPSTRA
jgi:hypothetical protein